MTYLSTEEAAELAGLSRKALYTLAGRARRNGVELHAPRSVWPDQRTPRWDGDTLRAHLAGRPGRGANLRKSGDDTADRGEEAPHCAGQLALGGAE